MLFEPQQEYKKGYARLNEDTFQFLQHSGRRMSEKKRALLNSWFEAYPDYGDHKKELKANFQSSYQDAFYELFIYTLFTKLGFELTPHPSVPNSEKRPDFLAKKGVLQFYIEAKVITGESAEEGAASKRQKKLLDEINNTRLNNHLLAVERLVIKTHQQPSAKEIKKQILDIDSGISIPKNFTKLGHPCLLIDNEKLYLRVSFIPVKSNSSSPDIPKRPIGVYPAKSWFPSFPEKIMKAMKSKKKYGSLDKPMLLCLNLMEGAVFDESDIDEIFWGEVDTRQTREGAPRKTVQPDPYNYGLFNPTSRHANQYFSGVFVSWAIDSNLHKNFFWLIGNPTARLPLDTDAIGLSHIEYKSGELLKRDRKLPAEILQIPDDWFERG